VEKFILVQKLTVIFLMMIILILIMTLQLRWYASRSWSATSC